MRFLFRLLVVATVLIGFSYHIFAHSKKAWIVPDETKEIKNPVKATKDSLDRGKKLYETNCIQCHGEKGDGKGSLAETLETKPANFTDTHMMHMMTDGEIFWKISKGRGIMQSWETVLSEKERWDLVNYIKTFAK